MLIGMTYYYVMFCHKNEPNSISMWLHGPRYRWKMKYYAEQHCEKLRAEHPECTFWVEQRVYETK